MPADHSRLGDLAAWARRWVHWWHPRGLRRWVPLGGWLLALGLLALAIGLVGRWTERSQLTALGERGTARLELYASGLEQQLAQYHHLPAAVRLNPDVLALVRAPNAALVARVNDFLRSMNGAAGASELYVLGLDGKVLAASNWDRPRSFVGVDLSYRPYFAQALRTGFGRLYALGTTSGEAGYYYARSINDGDGPALGVATVKVGLDQLQAPWQHGIAEAALAVDSDGVIILASEPDWKYRTLATLSEATRARIRAARQYENLPLTPLELRVERRLDGGASLVTLPGDGLGGQRRFLLQTRELHGSDWRMIVLTDARDVAATTHAAQALLALAVGFASLLLLYVQERRRVIRLELAAKRLLEQANIELERKVEERTQELLQAQDELVHASRLAALGQMAAVVAHELNQPLAALRTLSDNAVTLLERAQVAAAAGNLGMIGQIVARMANISGQLKLLATKPRAAHGRISLRPCVDHALMLLAPRLAAPGVELRTDLPAELEVVADAAGLEQVLVNLLANALDALGEDGGGRIEILARQEGALVRILVRDDGPGIDPALLPSLFEPFVTSKKVGAGLGLGLTICDGIVAELGGTLRARNRPEGGAEFVIELRGQGRAERVDG